MADNPFAVLRESLPENPARRRELARFAARRARRRAQFAKLRQPVSVAVLRAHGERWAAPLDDSLIAAREPFEADGISGEWTLPVTSERGVVVYVHGGGYRTGSITTYRRLAGDIAVASATPVLAIAQGLAPECAMPGPVDDVLSALRALASSGRLAAGYVLAGDSSGTALALAAIMRQRDLGMPLPVGLFLMSPYVDLTSQQAKSGRKTYDRNPDTCPMTKAMTGFFEHVPADSVLASPVLGDLRGLPPILVQVGGADPHLPQAKKLAKAVRRARGSIAVQVWPKMPHVFQYHTNILTDARNAIAAAGAWIASRLAAPGEAG